MKPIDPLLDVWTRLEALCAGLWSDNSPRAVAAQALLEQYRAEMARRDRDLGRADERLERAERDHELARESLREHHAAETEALLKRLACLESLLADKDASFASLLSARGEQDLKNAQLQADIVSAAAAREKEAARVLEELQTGFKARQDTLESRRAELEERQKRCAEQEDALERRSAELNALSLRLREEYRIKQQEIESLKSALQQNVTQLVQEYQSRLDAGTQAGPLS